MEIFETSRKEFDSDIHTGLFEDYFVKDFHRANMKTPIVDVLTYIRQHMIAENIGEYYVNLRSNMTLSRSVPNSVGDHGFTDIESHKYFEMAIQLDRQSLLQIGENYYVLKKYQFCIIDQGELHRMSWNFSEKQAASMLWIGITSEIVRTGYSVYSNNKRNKIWGSDLMIPGSFLINEILTERKKMGEGSIEAIISYIKMFLSLLLRKLDFSNESSDNSWSHKIVRELQNYIQENLGSNLSLQELSNHVSLSPNYLCKIFKQVTGETIIKYIQDMKIHRSVEYLADPAISLSSIAEMLGFYDQFHFSKVFKSFTGMSPSEYRHSLPKVETESGK